MALPAGLVDVEILGRANRFAVAAREAALGTERYLHLPNSGRMTELLTRGAQGLAALQRSRARRTDGTLLLVRHGQRWVGLDARLPNRLLAAGLAAGDLEPFRGVRTWRAEVRLQEARLDFRLEDAQGAWWVEVKSCNRVDGGVALFPDAPTQRGARHLRLLARQVARGRRAAAVWFVQRDDATVLRPFAAVDPDFAAAAREAVQAGVELYAYRCRVEPAAVTVLGPIPVQVADHGEAAPLPPPGGAGGGDPVGANPPSDQ